MTTVFIGGSRAVSRLNVPIRQQLDELITKNCAFYVGDANGADKAVQGYLAERSYPHVTVFCMDQCRNNIGGWSTRKIESESRKKNFNYYATKDRVMASEAKCGLMLWDGKSRGTLNNILTLLEAKKRVRVYLAKTKTLYTLSSESDLNAFLERAGVLHPHTKQIVLQV